ncbi:MAG: DUF3857 domain-containing protein [Cyclobacteriaceae bacterium]|jgi:hypothetical protein|nr:DUF3857 domain-containing protein [Cyclobacteriaceae bacterium]
MLKTLLLLLAPATVFSTGINPAVYEWEADRSRYELTNEEAMLGEYVLKMHNQYDYVFEDNQFLLYYTVHRIVRVNNDEAIQRNNRIYIPMGGVIDLVSLKARSINASGKVVNFDTSNLKELKDEETGRGYRIFAIEGVELGSEIEYFYVVKRNPSLYDRVFMQFGTPVRGSTFRLTAPKHLKFDFSSYNGYAPIKETTSTEDRNVYEGEMTNIPLLREENFSSFDANRQRIEFKLAYNTAKSNARLFTWEEAAKTFHGVLSARDKDDDKALDKFVKSLNDKASSKTEDRIRNIEARIKTTIQVNAEARDESLTDISSIIARKVASKEGMTRLFYLVFDRLGIACHPVLTCSREGVKFDGSFDSWAFLDEYLLHFPATGGFMAPYAFEFRYPLVPPDLTAQDGLFIEPFAFGNVKSALGVVRSIPPTDYSLNTDDLDISVTFDEGMTTNTIRMKREFGGCNATFIAPWYQMINDSDRAKLIEELVKQTAPDPTISQWKAHTSTQGPADSFIMDVTFTSGHFIGTAGSRVLFKAGELIGPQIEMYRDDDRMTDVENDFNRGYDRTIRISIPQGYQVRNPDDLRLNVVYSADGKEPFLFVSDYTMEGNDLVITIKEYYKEIFAPLERYEDFRKVINAAADFNKVILVLEKK